MIEQVTNYLFIQLFLFLNKKIKNKQQISIFCGQVIIIFVDQCTTQDPIVSFGFHRGFKINVKDVFKLSVGRVI